MKRGMPSGAQTPDGIIFLLALIFSKAPPRYPPHHGAHWAYTGCRQYRLEGVVHTTGLAGGFDCVFRRSLFRRGEAPCLPGRHANPPDSVAEYRFESRAASTSGFIDAAEVREGRRRRRSSRSRPAYRRWFRRWSAVSPPDSGRTPRLISVRLPERIRL